MITYRLFSPGVRFCHWILAACVLILFATGLYIGNPSFIGTQGKEPVEGVAALFSMETIRFIHFVTAAVFAGCLLLRFYLLFTYKGNRLFPDIRTRAFWSGLIEMITYYLFLRCHHQLYLRNPLARLTYVAVYCLMLVEGLTGLAMYAMIRPNSFLGDTFTPFIHLLGGEYRVHILHHIIAWMFILFLVVHAYLVFFTDVEEKNSEVSSMIGGKKHFKEHPVDSCEALLEEDKPSCS